MFQEFKNDPLDMQKRQQISFSDEFVFRKARIYKCMGPEDDRLQVQVLPELQGIDEEEMDDMPIYPSFYKGTVIVGKDYVTHGDSAEFVWVICTADLQVGYILGKSNIFGKMNEPYAGSYSYKDIRDYIAQRQALPADFDYKHLMVTQWTSTDQGGMFQCYNYMTGDWFLLNTSGSIITVQQQMIYMRVGTPPDPPESGPAAFSAITITSDILTLKSPNIVLDGQEVSLGSHGLKLAAMLGSIPATTGNGGGMVFPISNIST